MRLPEALPHPPRELLQPTGEIRPLNHHHAVSQRLEPLAFALIRRLDIIQVVRRAIHEDDDVWLVVEIRNRQRCIAIVERVLRGGRQGQALLFTS